MISGPCWRWRETGCLSACSTQVRSVDHSVGWWVGFQLSFSMREPSICSHTSCCFPCQLSLLRQTNAVWLLSTRRGLCAPRHHRDRAPCHRGHHPHVEGGELHAVQHVRLCVPPCGHQVCVCVWICGGMCFGMSELLTQGEAASLFLQLFHEAAPLMRVGSSRKKV